MQKDFDSSPCGPISLIFFLFFFFLMISLCLAHIVLTNLLLRVKHKVAASSQSMHIELRQQLLQNVWQEDPIIKKCHALPLPGESGVELKYGFLISF